MAFNIFFHGLVCHRTEDNTAVFVKAHGHELRMIVRKRDVVGASRGFVRDPQNLHMNPKINSKDQVSFIIDGHTLAIRGATPATSTFSSFFRRFVPSLRALSSCTDVHVKLDVRNLRTGGEIAGYLVHSGGDYSVNDFFPEKSTLTGNEEDADCVARTVKIAVTPDGGNITIADGTSRITLRPDAEVRFINVISNQGEAPSNEHFHHYFSAIYAGCGHGRGPRPAGGKRCNHRHDPSFAVPGGDCANSGDP